MSVTWEQAIEEIHRLADLASRNVCVELFDDMLHSISEQGPPRSEPGDPPHMDTQHLISNWELDGSAEALAYQMMSPDEYSIYLEMGTIHMEPRPYVMPAIIRAAGAKAEVWAEEGIKKSPAQLPRVWGGQTT
jgi:hypothetical protein